MQVSRENYRIVLKKFAKEETLLMGKTLLKRSLISLQLSVALTLFYVMDNCQKSQSKTQNSLAMDKTKK